MHVKIVNEIAHQVTLKGLPPHVILSTWATAAAESWCSQGITDKLPWEMMLLAEKWAEWNP